MLNRICFSGLLVALVAVTSWADDKPASKNDIKLSDAEKEVLELTNAQRKAANLPALQPNEKLLKAARSHSENMAKQQKLAHDLDDKSPFDRVKALGYEFSSCGENVAMGQRTPKEAMESWMKSEGHRANILNSSFAEIGIGQAKDANGQVYWTQVFGAPR